MSCTGNSNRLRVLLIAEAANPEFVSVPLEGWSHTRAIAERVDAHVVTQIRNREAFLRQGRVEGQDFTAIDTEALMRPLFRLVRRIRGGAGKGWTTVTAIESLAYPYFEWKVWQQFGEAIRDGAFDVVHRVTPLSPTAPSLLARRCRRAGVPFVLGPLNGGVAWPRGFDYARRREREWLSYVRGIYRLMPGYRATRRHAAAIIAGSRATLEQIPARYRDKCVYIPENAIDPKRFPKQRQRAAKRPLRCAFVGRLVPYKGADMLLEAAADGVRRGDLKFDIFGDGPEMPRLRQIVERERLADGVTLHGWVPHEQLAARLLDSDLFTFPSIREFGGAVVLEAMAVGLAPVIVGYGGPDELVTDQTGWRIPIGSREQVVRELRQTLDRLAANPAEIDARAARAADRARTQFTWAHKAWQTERVYRWVTGHEPRPDFGVPLPDPGDDAHRHPSTVRISAA